MRTLEDVVQAIDRMGVDPGEVPISRPAYKYLIRQAEEVLAVEEEEEEE